MYINPLFGYLVIKRKPLKWERIWADLSVLILGWQTSFTSEGCKTKYVELSWYTCGESCLYYILYFHYYGILWREVTGAYWWLCLHFLYWYYYWEKLHSPLSRPLKKTRASKYSQLRDINLLQVRLKAFNVIKRVDHDDPFVFQLRKNFYIKVSKRE